MNTNENEQGIVIDLKEIFFLFLHRLWLILLAAVIAGGSCFFYLKQTYVEEYTSKASISLAYTGDNASVGSTQSVLSLSMSIIEDCKYLITSRFVLNRVIADVVEDTTLPAEWRKTVDEISYNGLKGRISINNPSGTRILEISVRTGDPDLSKLLIDKLCTYSTAEIRDFFGLKYAAVIDEGTINRMPSNSISVTTASMAALAAAVVVFGIFLVGKLTDNKLHTAEDVSYYLGLSLLGEIPMGDFDSVGAKQKKHKGHIG